MGPREIAAILLAAVLVAPAFGQPPGGVTCTLVEGPPANVRAGGLSELLADIVMRCSLGSDPNTVRLSLDANITNAVGTDDPLLLFDDPGPTEQVLAPGTPGRVPNVFQGQRQGSNTIVWLGIPIDAPGSVGQRIMRIKNVRANASGIPRGGQITATIHVNGVDTGVPVPVGKVQPHFYDYRSVDAQPGQATGVVNAPILDQCQSLNPSLPNGTALPTFQLKYVEGFADAMKPRGMVPGTRENPFPEPVDQAMPTEVYGTETGFYNSAFPIPFGRADYGTRFAALFTNLPPDSRLFVGNRTSADSSLTAMAVAR